MQRIATTLAVLVAALALAAAASAKTSPSTLKHVSFNHGSLPTRAAQTQSKPAARVARIGHHHLAV